LAPEAAPAEEQLQLRERFLSLASEGRGSIGRRDLQEAFQGWGCLDLQGPEIDDLLEGLDLSGSGEVDYSEFLAAGSFQETSSGPCFDAFRSFDSADVPCCDALRFFESHEVPATMKAAWKSDSHATGFQTLAMQQSPRENIWKSLADAVRKIPKDLCCVIAGIPLVIRLFSFGLEM
jgi:hypothetical protein